MLESRFACPCCGYKTFFHEPNGSYEICEVCFWEDDKIQLNDPDYEGGANPMSLRQAHVMKICCVMSDNPQKMSKEMKIGIHLAENSGTRQYSAKGSV